MMRWLRKSVPAGLMAFYHRTLAVLADFYYGRPSKKMIIIGVTGTNGKTTVVSLIVKILETAGYKVGAASTAIFKIDQAERLNDRKMTMLGRFALQKLLAEMAAAGCQYAIIETSSQGIEQFRHAGIRYDVAVFTNLTPEHIEAHGGFGNYKAAKLKLFKHLEKSPVKIIGGKKIAKAIVVNGDDKYAGEFLNFRVDEKYVFGLNHKLEVLPMAVTEIIFANNLEYSPAGVGFKVDYHDFNLKLLGRFNV
ncbi:MAG: Mur ligase family protein, partial [Patescibacteria group bacterium]